MVYLDPGCPFFLGFCPIYFQVGFGVKVSGLGFRD